MSQYLDTRDLQKRLDELQEELDDRERAVDDLQEELDALEPGDDWDEKNDELADAKYNLATWQDDNGDELKELEEMESEIPEWHDGETLIPEDCWVEYVEELCIDCGYISKDLPGWIEIDWEKTADNVAMDYCTIDYQGTTYYYRA